MSMDHRHLKLSGFVCIAMTCVSGELTAQSDRPCSFSPNSTCLVLRTYFDGIADNTLTMAGPPLAKMDGRNNDPSTQDNSWKTHYGPTMPRSLLKAIAFAESEWHQWKHDGRVNADSK